MIVVTPPEAAELNFRAEFEPIEKKFENLIEKKNGRRRNFFFEKNKRK